MKTFTEFLKESNLTESIKSENELFKYISDFAINVSNKNRKMAEEIERRAEELDRDPYDRDAQSDLLAIMRKGVVDKNNSKILDAVEDFLEKL